MKDEYICRFGHIGHNSNHCEKCLRDAYGVTALFAAPAPMPSEEPTPVITHVPEGAELPVVVEHKHTHKKR